MGKHKKKHSKKDAASGSVLESAALSIRKYRRVTDELAKLSTGQKVLGGLLLLAAGYFYLGKLTNEGQELLQSFQKPARRLGKHKPAAPDDDDEDAPEAVETSASARKTAPRKNHKKSKHAPGAFGRPPAATPDDV
ncbi:hypothetical protein E5K00_15110 [Hymenobacter aquaticus]|uniref:Uncharacterized protein n=1 Tax=Hymenobacter aquaticus TaxID=1867101 RepID=A0A4Z0PWE3_9BACT|nr:hypothetical protein [Hymenobacter aquaticus]TGE21606.1 hypothetical protein E5K00_15110 [Hymenobacter aquaticus]